MKKKAIGGIFIILAVVGVFALLCVETFFNIRPKPEIYYDLVYETTTGGRIEGSTKQSILKGRDAQTVTAIPDEGYRFLRWSDTSSPNPVRKDTNIRDNNKPQAKFVKVSDVKYKILLIYVTEVQATFKDIDGNDIVADYKMTEEDLSVCKMTTELFDICLNEMFNGLVTFEIDEYYTTEVMREKNFDYQLYNEGYVDTLLWAENIPEVSDMLKDYGSYITTVALGGELGELTAGAGTANYKTATVDHLMSIPIQTDLDGKTIRRYDFLTDDYSNYSWVSRIDTYVHEFIHTVELSVTVTNNFLLHYVLHEYNKDYDGFDPNTYSLAIKKLYLLNQAEYNGRTAGIPFPVWTNEIYDLHYNPDDDRMGYVLGCSSAQFLYMRVAKGYDSEEVEAVPWFGYSFVGWSDGVETAKRIDRNIQADMEVFAIFEPIELTFKYIATEGGRIEGKAEQAVFGSYKNTEDVTAVPENGYKFVGWSDGYTESERRDCAHAGNQDLFDENYCLVITAIFEKL